MTVIDAALLGIVQGITEFLPISSDGHLIIAEHFLGLTDTSLEFDIVLHLGSLVAIILCYLHVWIRILRSLLTRDPETHRLLLYLVIATIPGAVIGLLFKDVVATTLRDPMYAALGFLASGFVLLLADAGTRGNRTMPTLFGSILIGCAQAAALLPGLSRSGSTIATARVLGLSRPAAVDFSFLMAAPIIAGAGLLPIIDVLRGEAVLPSTLVTLTGFSVSLLTSAGAILLLRLWVRRFSVAWFALYLLPLGAILLIAS